MTVCSMCHSPTAVIGKQGTRQWWQAAKQKALVDQSPWQTAQALAPLAVAAEEKEYAREAMRLADHEVDQAFDSALRKATLQLQDRVLTGDALALSQKVASLQQIVSDDQKQIDSLTAKPGSPASPAKGGQPTAGEADLDVTKAQLGLDSDDLADAQRDLERASGDVRAQIRSELASHEASMRKYDSGSDGSGTVAVLSFAQYGTLAGRVRVWFVQRDRATLIQQALQETQAEIASLTAEHNSLEAKASGSTAPAAGGTPDHAARLANIKSQRDQRQLLSIYDDRIQTEQQLVSVYTKWSAQVMLQHLIILHLILQSLTLIVFILICLVLCDAGVRKLVTIPAVDGRRMHKLRSVLELGVQVIGVLLVLLVIFGPPQQISTLLGLATAGLTIALQDFILAFCGWFILVGKNGIHLRDWVEINGVSGEVTGVGLIYTTLLETGNLSGKGLPTGRRTTFINSYAIHGQYFNFSTTGQWMWDEIAVTVPASADRQTLVDGIYNVALEETKENVRIAQDEWKRVAGNDGLGRFSATPVVNQQPNGAEIDIQVRYVTRASERFELRNRLYQQMIDLLQKNDRPA